MEFERGKHVFKLSLEVVGHVFKLSMKVKFESCGSRFQVVLTS